VPAFEQQWRNGGTINSSETRVTHGWRTAGKRPPELCAKAAKASTGCFAVHMAHEFGVRMARFCTLTGQQKTKEYLQLWPGSS
jgi:hypothetical protein